MRPVLIWCKVKWQARILDNWSFLVFGGSMDFTGDDIMRTEPHYSYEERKLRDDFVKEYMRDGNSYSACVRLGYMEEMAIEMAKKLMEEPYVKRQIANVSEVRSSAFGGVGDNLSSLPEGFTPHDEETDKQRIVTALFNEAFYKGPGSSHSSRVSALSKLADIYKLTKHDNKGSAGSVPNVMIVPPRGDTDDWEAQASVQQEELKRTVKE